MKLCKMTKRLPGTVIKARFISTSEKFIALKVDPP